MNTTAFDLAQRWIGVSEVVGPNSNPFVLGMLQLDSSWITNDETPWCSAFVNFIAWQLRLPRSKSLAAHSWLTIGQTIELADAVPGFDVVVLSRGTQLYAGHVGFFAGKQNDVISLLAGNQGNVVSIATFPVSRVIGVRRLLQETPAPVVTINHGSPV